MRANPSHLYGIKYKIYRTMSEEDEVTSDDSGGSIRTLQGPSL